jgi:hypothetical protein
MLLPSFAVLSLHDSLEAFMALLFSVRVSLS